MFHFLLNICFVVCNEFVFPANLSDKVGFGADLSGLKYILAASIITTLEYQLI